MRREYEWIHGRDVEVPKLTDEELKKGKKMLCPLHEGAEAFMVGMLEDAHLLAIHTLQVTLQPQDIQLARRIRGDPNWGCAQLHLSTVLFSRTVELYLFLFYLFSSP